MTRLEELRAEYMRLDDRINEEWNRTLGRPYKEYLEAVKPLYEERFPISRELHMTETDYTLDDLYRDSNGNLVGDLIPVHKFWKICECGGFIDSDGEGYYATETQESDIPAIPSEIVGENFRTDFPYVIWYNK